MKSQQQDADNAKVFAERLRQRMEHTGLRTSEVAAKLGLSSGAVVNWIAGDNQARGGNLRKLAELLGVTPAWLLGKEDEPSPGRVPWTFRGIADIEEELAMWKRRAQEAEKRLAALQAGLRTLPGVGSSSAPPAPEAPGVPHRHR
jgi:transcriptional regulator with XRE-family HTH domain